MDVVEAHRYSTQHRADILKSEVCGCFYCMRMFPPTAIDEWWDDDQTATCPHCGIDSVVGSGSGIEIDLPFLIEMRSHWFWPPEEDCD